MGATVSPSTRWLRRRRLESDGYPERRVDPSILALSFPGPRRPVRGQALVDHGLSSTSTDIIDQALWKGLLGAFNMYWHTVIYLSCTVHINVI